MVTVRLLVAYDGTDFHGLAPNPGVRTVVGELERVLEPLVGGRPDIVMSGRTDRGVHAWGQVLSFRMTDDPWAEDGWADGSAENRSAENRAAGTRVAVDRIQRSINSRLGPEIVAREVTLVPDDFSARFSAVGRHYRYLVINRAVDDPFLARTGWWVPTPLDVAAMSEACPHLLGEHDFTSFCRKPRVKTEPGLDPVEPSLVRRVDSARWVDLGDDLLRFEITGSAFCHQMVRSIVGFMIAVGTGKRRGDELPAVLAARDRSAAENPAPPHGLTLWQVDY